jgi:hypothetical protein
MKRRFKLGSEIVNSQLTPTLKFSQDGRKMILTFPINSEIPPNVEDEEKLNPRRHTHRDVLEITGGDAYGAGMSAKLVSVGESETVLNLTMKVNSKIPGTGTAFASLMPNGDENGNHESIK